MGNIEKKIRADIRRSKINSAVIATLAVSGALALAVLAPNVLGVLGKTGMSAAQKQGVKRSINRLAKYGYVAVKSDGTRTLARLTPKGEKYAARIGEGTLIPKTPKRWDKKWRILIFDIAEKRRKARDHVRSALVSLGFHRLQDSVWVHPYDCEDLITILKTNYHLNKEVLYVVADIIENEHVLQKQFNLTQYKK